MTKFFISVKALSAVALSGVLIFSIGCNNNNQPDVSPVSSVAKTEYTSEIDQMEKEEGVTFFKKDVWIKDEAGKDQVLMRFASKNENVIAHFMEMHAFKVITSSSNNGSQEILPSTPNNQESILQAVPAPTGRIFVEELSRKPSVGLGGYAIDFSANADVIQGMKAGRIAETYDWGVTQLCPSNNPKKVQVKATRYQGTPSNLYPQKITVTYGIDSKNCTLCQWYSWDNKPWDKFKLDMNFNNYGYVWGAELNTTMYSVWHTGVNGTYRSRVNIQYNYRDIISHQIEWKYSE
jgi:hypothetical protein